MDRIDLRSDTVTRPGPEMRRAMAEAEVGDDVYGEDPTVRRLEARAAELLGKEAALFVPSGTMANQIAVQAQTRPGDVVLATAGAHLLQYEGGGAAALSGVQIRTLGTEGRVSADALEAALPPDDPHYAPVTLLAAENTHNDAGGRVFPEAALAETCARAQRWGLARHLDGARLFNAVAATGVAPARWASHFETVAFCLSKGLGAPVGSLVVGPASLRPALDRVRKRLGGGMRQAGILAAAGLFALDHHLERLSDDHQNAARLAAGLSSLGARVEAPPETNIVMFHAAEAADFWRQAIGVGVLFNPPSGTRLRAVTHLDVSTADIDEALTRLQGLTGLTGP